jgi:small ligand-binding sensory domain FIST
MKFASAISEASDLQKALNEVTSTALEQLDTKPDLAIVFISSHHGPDFSNIASSLREKLETDHLIGCTGESIAGNGRELEQQPAISLWLGVLPDVSINTRHIQFKSSPEDETFTGLPDPISEDPDDETSMILFGDPFTFPASKFLEHMDDSHPDVDVIGGMASGGRTPGQNAIFMDDDEYRDGAAVAVLSGPVQLKTIVSQGCRPIGPHFVVTRSEGNVIQELGGEPALQQLQGFVNELPAVDQQLVQEGLHIGKVINEQQDSFDRGDFLIRNVVGIDQESGAIQIGGPVRPGQTVQFQVRDASSADEDLRELLGDLLENSTSRVESTLLFTCNGRGTRLFEEEHHDAGLIQETFGDIPSAGFFAQGELGPVGGKNFIHGYTACIALFEETNPPSDQD